MESVTYWAGDLGNRVNVGYESAEDNATVCFLDSRFRLLAATCWLMDRGCPEDVAGKILSRSRLIGRQASVVVEWPGPKARYLDGGERFSVEMLERIKPDEKGG